VLDIYDRKSVFTNLKVGCSSVCLVRANSTLCVCVFCLVGAVHKFHFTFVTNT
jgi:hypothetical protein